MTRREKIIEIFKKHESSLSDDYGNVMIGIDENEYDIIADDILALPLDVPSKKNRNCDGCGTPLSNYCEKCQRMLES